MKYLPPQPFRFACSFACFLLAGVCVVVVAVDTACAKCWQTGGQTANQANSKTTDETNDKAIGKTAGSARCGTTALHWAVRDENVGQVKTLLASNADPDAQNRFAATPLRLAAQAGNAQILKLLIEAGADVNRAGDGRESALMLSARNGRPAAVRCLIDAGAEIDASDSRRQTALMWAANDGHARAVKLLLEAGADEQLSLKSGFNAWFFAVRQGHRNVVQVMLDHGQDVKQKMDVGKGGGRRPVSGTEALSLAVENGHFTLAKMLLDAGADPDAQSSGVTPLHRLTWVRKPDRGDGINGSAPPIGSGSMTSLELIDALVAAGANVNARLNSNPANLGRMNNKLATPLFMAARTADLEMMKRLIKHGADISIPNADGATPLLVAAGVGCFSPAEEAGTEVQAIAAVDYLLGLGAEIDLVDKLGRTVVHGAADKSFPEMARFLVKNGAKIELWNRKNKRGQTPLGIAKGYRPGNFKPSAPTIAAIADLMREAGVDPDAVVVEKKPAVKEQYKK